jgi:hypothetical protein
LGETPTDDELRRAFKEEMGRVPKNDAEFKDFKNQAIEGMEGGEA